MRYLNDQVDYRLAIMTNDQINDSMRKWLLLYGLSPLSQSIVDRDGRTMDLSGSVWKFNVPTQKTSFDWTNIEDCNVIFNYSLRRWAEQLLAQQSARAVATSLFDVVSALRGGDRHGTKSEKVRESWIFIAKIKDPNKFGDVLRVHMRAAIQYLRSIKQMENFYRLRDWYVRCSDVLGCLGFDEEFALELNQVWVPGRQSGLAVELECEESGPLWDTEVAVLRKALLEDDSSKREHVMQRAAIALSLAFGRNPSNYCLLREPDLKNALAGFDVPEQWVLSIPRIKKPGLGPRCAFIDERVDGKLVRFVKDIIASNREIDFGDFPRPLFARAKPDAWFDGTGMVEYKFHLGIEGFRALLTSFVNRLKVVSPKTGRLLAITPRRLRYTFATTMVERGVSRRVLAAMLDHSDTQHVQVYYSLRGKNLTAILDRAAAIRLGPLMNLFRGKLVASPEDAINGSNPEKSVKFFGDLNSIPAVDIGGCGKERRCSLDPPFSCYTCPKFQPYVEADHEAVLRELLASREERREKYGLQIAIQLDDVIYAVGQIIVEVAAYVRRKKK